MKFSTVCLGLLTIAVTSSASEIDDIESKMLRKKNKKAPKKKKKSSKDTCSRSCTIKPLDADMLIAKVSPIKYDILKLLLSFSTLSYDSMDLFF